MRPLYNIARKEVERGKIEVTIKDFPRTTESYRHYQICVRSYTPVYAIMTCFRMLQGIVRDLKETTCKVSEGTFLEAQYANIPAVPYELPDGSPLPLFE